MELITGYSGTHHIVAEDDGSLHAGIIGTGDYVLDIGSQCACEVVSSNLVRIKDGDVVMQGRHARIPSNTADECIIENGTQGQLRNDLIVIRYHKDPEGIESTSTVVVKGAPGSTAKDPAISAGSITAGDSVHDMPLYRVRLNGVQIAGVDALFAMLVPGSRLQNRVSLLEANQVKKSDLPSVSVNYANSAGSVAWGNVSGKPGTYPPSGHTHDDRYYTESETNNLLAGKSNIGHAHDDRYYTETEVNGLLTSHNHDGRYYTEAEVNDLLAVKDATFNINAVGFKLEQGSICRVGKIVSLNLYIRSYDGVMGNKNLLNIGGVNPAPRSDIIFSVIDDDAKRPLAGKLQTNGALGVTGDGLTGERFLVINLTYMTA